MNNLAKVILLSQSPLPSTKIGSWTTLYKNYLEDSHKIDCIVCPKPQQFFDGVTYSFTKFTFWHKLQRKFLKRKNLEYFKALDRLLVPNEKYILQIVDNYGMVKPLKDYLVSKGAESRCYIQFFYHGFFPYNQPNSGKDFYEIIDELIVLTKDSYLQFKNVINVLPNYFSILNNGIDTQKFKMVTTLEKIELKHKLGFAGKNVFVWCAQDRPKKGLHVILSAWKKIYREDKNIVLIVIGCAPRERMDGVTYLGRIPNDELPKYYQVADCYLFPTLCQEGFGMSLIEALHSGNYCIASEMGGVPEVLQYGKLGNLVKNPHFVEEWEIAINDFLEGKYELPQMPDKLYSKENWNKGMNEIIEQAKFRIAKDTVTKI